MSAVKDINDLLDYLPHRYPFLLVDRVTELEVGKRVAGYKNVTMNEPFFQGHFPGHPIMPGVLIIEAMAQLAGVLAFETKNTRPKDGYVYYLAGTDKVRFKRPVLPGDKLAMTAEIMIDRRQIMKFDCKAYVDDEIACSGEILCVERKL